MVVSGAEEIVYCWEKLSGDVTSKEHWWMGAAAGRISRNTCGVAPYSRNGTTWGRPGVPPAMSQSTVPERQAEQSWRWRPVSTKCPDHGGDTGLRSSQEVNLQDRVQIHQSTVTRLGSDLKVQMGIRNSQVCECPLVHGKYSLQM